VGDDLVGFVFDDVEKNNYQSSAWFVWLISWFVVDFLVCG